MGAGRPPKKGLSYHSSDVDYYEDYKIIDLLNEYGPLGQTIYDVVIKMVYRNGYYLEIPMDKLALSVIKTIGNKWIKNKGLVLQVVQYCSDIGLFDDALLKQSVITSVGIQKRYSLATVRNKVHKEKYWLLKEESEKPLLNAPKNSINDTKNDISVTEIQNNAEKNPINKSKENNYIYFTSPQLESSFSLYVMTRNQNGDNLSADQIELLKEELLSLSSDEAERIAIVKKATMSGWKSFYPLSKKKKSDAAKPVKKSNNKFNNFESRNYDMQNLERTILEKDQIRGV